MRSKIIVLGSKPCNYKCIKGGHYDKGYFPNRSYLLVANNNLSVKYKIAIIAWNKAMTPRARGEDVPLPHLPPERIIIRNTKKRFIFENSWDSIAQEFLTTDSHARLLKCLQPKISTLLRYLPLVVFLPWRTHTKEVILAVADLFKLRIPRAFSTGFMSILLAIAENKDSEIEVVGIGVNHGLTFEGDGGESRIARAKFDRVLAIFLTGWKKTQIIAHDAELARLVKMLSSNTNILTYYRFLKQNASFDLKINHP